MPPLRLGGRALLRGINALDAAEVAQRERALSDFTPVFFRN
jgi:hypothetical protein